MIEHQKSKHRADSHQTNNQHVNAAFTNRNHCIRCKRNGRLSGNQAIQTICQINRITKTNEPKNNEYHIKPSGIDIT